VNGARVRILKHEASVVIMRVRPAVHAPAFQEAEKILNRKLR
jgi:hypothetical protein